MASAPRRPSQSPQKPQPMDRPRDIFDEPPSDPMEVEPPRVDLEIANPFQKRSVLRRSPPSGATDMQAQGPAELGREAQIDPFKRGGLRRSGAGVAPAPIQNEPPRQDTAPGYEVVNPFEKRGLRRSDPRNFTESMAAMLPPPPPSQRQIQEEEQQQQEDRSRAEQRRPESQREPEPESARQPRRSIAVKIGRAHV